MNTNYPVGDFLIRIKNAAMAKKRYVEFDSTKLVEEVAKTLAKEGYLDEVTKEDGRLIVRLTFKWKEPLLMNLRLISKPGMRVYMNLDNLRGNKGPSNLIVSTSKGVMMDKEAVKKNLGGEVIAEVL
ncbi:30S ribosomal protein S8 [Candidatus Woesebacteria bacterium RIFCSPLOWO2_01_FULL_39_61]|uniref:Small ribosomal subunit protein uS8 n=1 Tax=Candidatus Woesebacteria bacterium RIFCSPHIGHO2_02_FULL_39_13 TaxID=1802505 RepID=A0A1F7Z334_9BACT|nr:MAG: 30S ribosomal protein S8 [Candidatus Woesebacteria bacterium RIFCSPHIGHO2_01_FULL_39_95]OGM34063.1 MAG: 30S ribosomal protein S8 [Candidatus Woesebacteria bacterium RIFCSPHIGHO2_02_FULL_39_13]OGM38322.1 MAG: 30S ribosomal protein S8 [Candidatus Woesebacteria bacterium RIFCSPHIGHO2_12_FULL_40_20]OGM67785.1 MAG: 30S ribosomal protein S8 [Candidatus Woesebacteria bacterium RIFCSPLOWO2_01_FULL_39_61]OGM72733.1 MAG: 30S ribosomal protein S8 [Candidatus Woesebacteria bacterium RIFCSPLOWO2_12_